MPKIHIEKPTVHIHIGAPAPTGIPSLGLALVQTVVLRHGGTLEVESDVGRGAEFRLVLPQRLDAPSDGDA